MRRLGALLMIIGANLAVGSLAFAVYLAAIRCTLDSASGGCAQGTASLLIELLISRQGLIFWLVIAAGVLVFWRGWQLRQREG